MALRLGGDMHLRCTLAAVLRRSDQVLQEPGQLPRRTVYRGQGIHGSPWLALVDWCCQAGERPLQHSGGSRSAGAIRHGATREYSRGLIRACMR